MDIMQNPNKTSGKQRSKKGVSNIDDAQNEQVDSHLKQNATRTILPDPYNITQYYNILTSILNINTLPSFPLFNMEPEYQTV